MSQSVNEEARQLTWRQESESLLLNCMGLLHVDYIYYMLSHTMVIKQRHRTGQVELAPRREMKCRAEHSA